MKAFEWSQTQPPTVRERAGSADALVALYLQAKRRGTAADGTPLQWEQPSPASVEAFKADLKNLAEGLRAFDDDSLAPPHTTGRPAPLDFASEPAVGFRSPPVMPPAAPAYHVPPPAPPAAATHAPPHQAPPVHLPPPVNPAPTASAARPNAPAAPRADGVSSFLDPKSRQWILEVQSRLNLSTEDDALRTLIAIGYERIRDLLPRS